MSYSLHTRKTWAQTRTELEATMDKWGVRDWRVHCKLDGRSATKEYQTTAERTVELSYVKNGREIRLRMDTQPRAVDNFRVLYLAVEAMRMNEARGIAEVMASAYSQALATAGSAPQSTGPYAVLGVRPDASWEVIEAAYRAKVRANHPDTGGSTAALQTINAAMDAIRKAKGRV